MNCVAFRAIVSAMPSSTHSAERPPVIHPMREMPLTIVLSWPWLGRSFSSSGFSDPVGQSPTLWS